MNPAALPSDIGTRFQWAALHHAGYQETPDFHTLSKALTDPEPTIWRYAQRILRRILPMASLSERWPDDNAHQQSISSDLPGWIQKRCADWGPEHPFVVHCAELLGTSDNSGEQRLLHRLTPFLGAAHVILTRLRTSGRDDLAMRCERFFRDLMNRQFPLQLSIMPTLACQLHCQYCYSAGLPGNASNTMPLDELRRLLDWAHNGGITRICLSGGEPTLYPHLQGFLDFISTHGMEYLLATNGLFGAETLDQMLAIPPLSVSMHINPENDHSSNKARFVANARAFATAGIMVALRFNLTMAGMESYKAYFDLCAETGVRQIRMAVPVPNFRRTNSFVDMDNNLNAFAHTIDQLITLGHQNEIEVMLAKPFPLCRLTEKSAEILVENGSYNANCQVHLQQNTHNLTVYPDIHFSPCLSLNQRSAKPIFAHADIIQAAASFKTELDHLSRIPLMAQCRRCPLSAGGRCVGACFSYRVDSDANPVCEAASLDP